MQARERQEDLKKLLEKYLLRRTKDNTIKDQLPSKTDNIVFCELSELQLKAYRCPTHALIVKHLATRKTGIIALPTSMGWDHAILHEE